eukprot:COSAG02_NODE_79842_length_109_cov_819.800000_1_plen_28_part_01
MRQKLLTATVARQGGHSQPRAAVPPAGE